MKPLIIYHDSCTDGYGAAFAAYLKFGDRAEYLPCSYGRDFEASVCTGREVYIVDFSFPAEKLKQIIQLSTYFVWLDHHKTAFEVWAGDERELYLDETEYTYIVLDNNKSGALLAWEYFVPNEDPPLFIRMIDDRDRWQFKIQGSSDLHAGMQARKPWSFEQWTEMLIDDEFVKVLTEGAVLIKARDQQVRSITKHAGKCDIIVKHYTHEDDCPEWRHYQGLAVNTSSHMSEVGHALANMSGTYGLIWYMDQDRSIKCSLRSNGDYDVSYIAKKFGGGGHNNAAGFSTDIDTLLGWLR